MTIAAQTGKGATVAEERPQYQSRISRDELYMEVARLFSKRSTCLRGHTGCVAVKDNRIIGAGYNGAPAGMNQCDEVGCGGGVWPDGSSVSEAAFIHNISGSTTDVTFPNGCTRAIHAEANLVVYAGRDRLAGSTVYMLSAPCIPCAQLLVAAGITRMVYEVPYRVAEGLELIKRAGIEAVKYGE